MAKLVRFATLPYEETLEKLKAGQWAYLAGQKVNGLRSSRINCLIAGGGKCVRCGLQGSLWALERHHPNEPYHVNLYGLGKKNKEVMLTRDHIIPKSKGGTTDALNCQVLCSKCNTKKADLVQLGSADFSTSCKNIKFKTYFCIKNEDRGLALVDGVLVEVKKNGYEELELFKTSDLNSLVRLWKESGVGSEWKIIKVWELEPIEEEVKFEEIECIK